MAQIVIGKPDWSPATIVGSFLLLNGPSIGYVWIMRVFLLMAIIMPLLERATRRLSFPLFLLLITAIIALQSPLVMTIESIPNKLISFGLDEVVAYAFGYSALAIAGLRLSRLSRRDLAALIILSAAAIIIVVGLNGWTFDPQSFKYPPRGLYLLYGLGASTLLVALRPVLARAVDCRAFSYLSRHSMWIYLWHIIPVYALTPWMELPGLWVARYCAVVVVAVGLNMLWQRLLDLLHISYPPLRG